MRAAAVSALGLGYLRPAPGTWGSLPPPLVAIGLAWALGHDGLSGADAWIIDGVLLGLAVLASVACVALGRWAEEHYGRKDPSHVVADEVAGQAIALIALPWDAALTAGGTIGLAALAAAPFLVFRAMDIVKPFPARGLQRLRGGWGILIDDLVAGAYALLVVQLAARAVL